MKRAKYLYGANSRIVRFKKFFIEVSKFDISLMLNIKDR
jgi:hypothetical protein